MEHPIRRLLISASLAAVTASSGCAGESQAVRRELVELRAELRAMRQRNEQLEKRVQRMEDVRAVEDVSKEQPHVEAPMPALTVVKLKPKAERPPVIATATAIQEPDEDDVVSLLSDDTRGTPRSNEAAEKPQDALFAEAAFQDALQALKTGNVSGAVLKLQQFVVAYPRHAHADNALYYSGVGLIGLEDLEGAASAFERVLAEYPAGDARIDSMLKLADCRLKLNQRDQATELYARLINTYPGTTAAREARERLAKITQ